MKFYKLFLIVLLVFSNISQATPDFERISKSIVSIILVSSADPHDQTKLGSGFIVTDNGIIMTNSHVIKYQYDNPTHTYLLVKLYNGNAYVAAIVGDNPENDVGILVIRTKTEHKLALSMAEPKLGDTVYAMGFPLGMELTLTSGIISGKNRLVKNLGNTQYIQSDVVTNRGNSGGPLLNTNGHVIGINTAIQGAFYMGYSYAVQIKTAIHIARELIQHGKFEKATLGIVVSEPDILINHKKGILTYPRGAVITKMSDGYDNINNFSFGDIIIALNGEDVNNIYDIGRIAISIKPNEEVNMILSTTTQCVLKRVKLTKIKKPVPVVLEDIII